MRAVLPLHLTYVEGLLHYTGKVWAWQYLAPYLCRGIVTPCKTYHTNRKILHLTYVEGLLHPIARTSLAEMLAPYLCRGIVTI